MELKKPRRQLNSISNMTNNIDDMSNNNNNNNAHENLMNIISNKESSLIQTDHPYVKCTKLPDFWRIKKSLHEKFCVYFLNNMCKDGTKVEIRAGNKKFPCGELKNNEAYVKNGIAEFSDLRFVSTSGRGEFFCLFFS